MRFNAPLFQQRHYIAIAAIIAALPLGTTRAEIAQWFADRLQGTNPHFDHARFLRAASGTPDRRDTP